jgi:membrane associated rhomboid family serine protease
MVNYWLAVTLPIIPILIWIRPRIRILKLNDKRKNLPFLYQFSLLAAIAVPTIITQTYLETATGKLTTLQSIDQINDKPLTKYYELKEHYVSKNGIAVYQHTAASGKNNEYLGFYIDVACPILSTNNGGYNLSNTGLPKAWLCYEFKKNISNNIGDAEKEQEYKAFDTLVNKEFKEKNFDDFIYLDRIGHNDRHKGYLEAIRSKFNNAAEPVILEGVNEPFEARNGNKLRYLLESFVIAALVWLIMIIIPKIDNTELEKHENDNFSSNWHSFSDSLKRTRLKGSNIQITIIIIALNVFVFLIMAFAGLGFISFDSHDLLKWGADFAPKVKEGEWWRLLTSIFLHEGLMHLVNNMYGFLFAGLFLEPILGRIKFTSAYLICGLVASIVSIYWHPYSIGIGASGAIFGMYGVLIALLTTKKVSFKENKGLLAFALIFVIINLLLGLAGSVDNSAHIGGLISGLIIGYLFYFFGNLPRLKTEIQ